MQERQWTGRVAVTWVKTVAGATCSGEFHHRAAAPISKELSARPCKLGGENDGE